MTHLQNAHLRNQAFVKFLLMFFIAMTLVIAAIYFDVHMPVKENDMLRERIKTYNKQAFQQEEVIAAMNAAKKLLDSMSQQPQFNALLDRDIVRQLEIVKKPLQQNNIYARMNQEAFNLLFDYYELNKKLLLTKDLMLKVQNLQNELTQCQTRMAEAERDLDVYRRSSTLGM